MTSARNVEDPTAGHTMASGAGAEGKAAPKGRGAASERPPQTAGALEGHDDNSYDAEQGAILSDQLRLIGTVLASLRDGALALDGSGHVVAANPAAQAALGWEASELLGRHIHDLAHAEDGHTAEDCPLLRPIHTAEAVQEARASLLRKDGERLAVACVSAPLALGKDLPAALFTFHGLTERLSEMRQRTIVESSLDAIVGMGSDGRILEFNPAAERMFGWSRDEVLGADMARVLIPARWRSRHRAAFKHHLQTGEAHILGQRTELTALRADGSEFPIELTVSRIGPDDAPEFLALIRDISERVSAEEERVRLLESERAARADAEAAIRQFESVQAITDAALLHLNLADVIGELIARVRTMMHVDNVAILLPTPDQRELRVYSASGPEEEVADRVHVPMGQGFAGRIAAERRPFIVNDVAEIQVANPMLREKLRSLLGLPLLVEDRLIGVIHVGTAQKRTFTEDDVRLLEVVADRIALAIEHSRLYEAQRRTVTRLEDLTVQLRSQAAELNTFIEAIAGGVFVCDAEGYIIRANRYAGELLGLPQERLNGPIGRIWEANLPRYLDGTPLYEEDNPLAQALRGVTRTDFRFTLRRSDTGKDVQVQCSFAPVRDAAGAITGAVVVATDVTHLYWLERQKDEFLSIASHELKTPLTTLKIMTQLIQRRLLRSGILDLEHSSRMERSIDRMERLINDLLDVSRIDSGKLALRIERTNLAAICMQAAEEQVALAERPVTVRMPNTPVDVEADAERINQVITNLLSNSLKYTPPNKAVTLSLDVEENVAVVRVHDEGVGIPHDALERLFEQFYRVPGVQVQHGSGVGLGLGLYISREIVERHGGRIWAESGVGEGSTFAFRLPLAPSE